MLRKTWRAMGWIWIVLSSDSVRAARQSNRAADDAAGLAISENLKSLIRVFARPIEMQWWHLSGAGCRRQPQWGFEYANSLARIGSSILHPTPSVTPKESSSMSSISSSSQRSSDHRYDRFNGYDCSMETGGVIISKLESNNNPFLDRNLIQCFGGRMRLWNRWAWLRNCGHKDSAQMSLTAVDNALVSVNAIRANFGLSESVLLNLTKSEGHWWKLLGGEQPNSWCRIAAESTELMRNNILQQAAISFSARPTARSKWHWSFWLNRVQENRLSGLRAAQSHVWPSSEIILAIDPQLGLMRSLPISKQNNILCPAFFRING